jgi:hypothetical protein
MSVGGGSALEHSGLTEIGPPPIEPPATAISEQPELRRRACRKGRRFLLGGRLLGRGTDFAKKPLSNASVRSHGARKPARRSVRGSFQRMERQRSLVRSLLGRLSLLSAAVYPRHCIGDAQKPTPIGSWPGTAGGPRIGLVRYASFSHFNANALRALQSEFKGCTLIDVDIGQWVARNELANLLCTGRGHGRRRRVRPRAAQWRARISRASRRLRALGGCID